MTRLTAFRALRPGVRPHLEHLANLLRDMTPEETLRLNEYSQALFSYGAKCLYHSDSLAERLERVLEEDTSFTTDFADLWGTILLPENAPFSSLWDDSGAEAIQTVLYAILASPSMGEGVCQEAIQPLLFVLDPPALLNESWWPLFLELVPELGTPAALEAIHVLQQDGLQYQVSPAL